MCHFSLKHQGTGHLPWPFFWAAAERTSETLFYESDLRDRSLARSPPRRSVPLPLADHQRGAVQWHLIGRNASLVGSQVKLRWEGG